MYATVSILSIVDWTARAEQVSQLLLCVSAPLRSALADPNWKCQSLRCVPLFCNPMSCSAPGSSVQGNSQARILEWVAIPFSRGSFWPRDWTRVSWPTGTVVSVHGIDSQVSSAPNSPRPSSQHLVSEILFPFSSFASEFLVLPTIAIWGWIIVLGVLGGALALESFHGLPWLLRW